MKSNNITIEFASTEDASAWVNMLIMLDGETEFTKFESGERSTDTNGYKEIINSITKNPCSALIFAKDNHLIGNKVVGYVIAEAYKNNRKSHVTTVGIGVLKSYRKAGVAIQLCKAMRDYASRNGMLRMEALIAASNYRSFILAQKYGFIVEGIKKKIY
jgi:RimJ/RimL family protein N-acetyltransferase